LWLTGKEDDISQARRGGLELSFHLTRHSRNQTGHPL
jgi:hypothetical protein